MPGIKARLNSHTKELYMHYYKFNIADWAKDTSHLTLKEEAVYFRLINYYYDHEKPIPLKTQSVLRKLRMGDESETVEIILDEFFTKTKDGWIHSRCDKLIQEYQKRSERNRSNGKSGGRPKNKDLDKPTGLSAGSNKNPNKTEKEPTLVNHKPLTTNQEPETNNKDLLSASADAVAVLTYMNEVCGSKFKHTTKSHIENINARLNDYTVEDCKLVIDKKFSEWGGDDRMASYLRPQTLFSAGKFDGYLMAAKASHNTSKHDLSSITYTSGKL